MTQFYVSIIFLGILLIGISIVLVAYDKKRSADKAADIGAKKQELVGIINDADEMIQELNKFSDYVVSQINLKNEEMSLSLKKYEEQIESLNARISENLEIMQKADSVSQPLQKVVNGNLSENNSIVKEEGEPFRYGNDLVIDSKMFENAYQPVHTTSRQTVRSKDKVIPINSRHKEVIRLATGGMNSTEIAKQLKMGKGEIQLILDLNK